MQAREFVPKLSTATNVGTRGGVTRMIHTMDSWHLVPSWFLCNHLLLRVKGNAMYVTSDGKPAIRCPWLVNILCRFEDTHKELA